MFPSLPPRRPPHNPLLRKLQCSNKFNNQWNLLTKELSQLVRHQLKFIILQEESPTSLLADTPLIALPITQNSKWKTIKIKWNDIWSHNSTCFLSNSIFFFGKLNLSLLCFFDWWCLLTMFCSMRKGTKTMSTLIELSFGKSTDEKSLLLLSWVF